MIVVVIVNIRIFRIRFFIEVGFLREGAGFVLVGSRPGTFYSVYCRPHLRSFFAYRRSGGVVEPTFSHQVLREVEPRRRSSQVKDGGVVSTGSGHRCGVGAQPYAWPLVGFSNLSHPLPPLPHPYPLVPLLTLPRHPLPRLSARTTLLSSLHLTLLSNPKPLYIQNLSPHSSLLTPPRPTCQKPSF